MTTNNLTDIEIDEISILSKDVRPAVRAARIAIAKKEDHIMRELASFDTLDAAVEAIVKREGCARHEAMSAAGRRYPDLVRKYNDEGVEMFAKAAEAARPRPVAKAVADFDVLVDDIAARDRVPRHEAMAKAAHLHPDALRAYQEA